jgi:hypothetical protein
MNIERIVVLTIASGAGRGTCPADGSDNRPLPTGPINAVRHGVSSPTTIQK